MSAYRLLSAAAVLLALSASPNATAGAGPLFVVAADDAPAGIDEKDDGDVGIRRDRRSGQGDHRADVCRDARHDCAIANTVGSPEYLECLKRHGC